MKLKSGKGVGISVETGEITNGAVTEDKIGALAVTEGKIGALAVTNGKIGADAIDSTKIADAAIAIEHVTQTGRAANYSIKANAANTALEFGLATVDPLSNMTIGGTTMTVEKWLLL